MFLKPVPKERLVLDSIPAMNLDRAPVFEEDVKGFAKFGFL